MTLPCLVVAALALGAMPTRAEITKQDVEGIDNFSRYTGAPTFAGDSVGFGGATEPEAMARLKALGFSTVISLRLSDEDDANIEANRAAAAAAGLEYIHLPFDAEQPAADLEANFLSAASDASRQPVYIHCSSATRASILWMIGRTEWDGVDTEAAEAEGSQIAGKPEKALEYFSKRAGKQ